MTWRKQAICVQPYSKPDKLFFYFTLSNFQVCLGFYNTDYSKMIKIVESFDVFSKNLICENGGIKKSVKQKCSMSEFPSLICYGLGNETVGHGENGIMWKITSTLNDLNFAVNVALVSFFFFCCRQSSWCVPYWVPMKNLPVLRKFLERADIKLLGEEVKWLGWKMNWRILGPKQWIHHYIIITLTWAPEGKQLIGKQMCCEQMPICNIIKT